MQKTINFLISISLAIGLFACASKSLPQPTPVVAPLPPQEEYPLQTHVAIKYESSVCSLNKSGYSGVHQWQAKISDGNMSTALTRWAKIAGWQVKWESKYDIPIEYPWTIKTTFDCAVNELLKNTQSSQLPLMGQMYLSNKVLLIINAK